MRSHVMKGICFDAYRKAFIEHGKQSLSAADIEGILSENWPIITGAHSEQGPGKGVHSKTGVHLKRDLQVYVTWSKNKLNSFALIIIIVSSLIILYRSGSDF